MAKTDIPVQELVDKVKRHELRLPEMQRRYVWTSTQVRDLIDSLYRGYPSGTILVWEPGEEVEVRNLSVDTTNTPSTSHFQLLLDGQQRLTSLTALIFGEPINVRNRKRAIEILFNLDHPEGPPMEVMETDYQLNTPDDDAEEEEANSQIDVQEELKKRAFVVGTRQLKNDPHWVSVSDVFDKTDKEILKPLGINSDDDRWDKYSKRLEKLRDIRKYQYVMQILEKNMSYEEVTEIFVRVNSLGIKLRGSDLALAQITAKWKGFMNLLEKFADIYGDDADYILNWVSVRALTVFATQQGKFNTIGRVSRDRLEAAWEQAKLGINYAVNFLRSNAMIDNLNYTSSPMLLIPIAVYAVQHEERVSPEDTKKLLRWFYLAHTWGHYGMGSSESWLNADLAVLFRGGTLDDLIKQLQSHVKKFEVEPGDIAGKGINSPFFSTLYFIMHQQGVRDWTTGLALSGKHTGATHQIQYHHIFPKSLLKKAGYESREINELSNMAFIGGRTNRQVLNHAPIEYLEQVIEKVSEDGLRDHLIPSDRALWGLDRYPAFLAYRRAEIARLMNEFIRNLQED